MAAADLIIVRELKYRQQLLLLISNYLIQVMFKREMCAFVIGGGGVQSNRIEFPKSQNFVKDAVWRWRDFGGLFNGQSAICK